MTIWVSANAKIYSTRNMQVFGGNQKSAIKETTSARECEPILCRVACDWMGSENRQAVTW
jgi:hypothetical protein